MNILILNWRDIKNPAGGGAELLTHEMAKRWAASGNEVTMLTAAFTSAKKEELVDGVKIIRKGRWWNIHIIAFFLYVTKLKNKTDIIIDEVHWFPFFSVLYARDKTIAFTCEVANKLFFRILPFPAALFFRSLEKLYLYLYKDVPTMVISPSTYDDLVASGHRKNNILILPMGLTVPPKIKIDPKAKYPVIICVGRLNKQKGTLDTVDAFIRIKKELPNSQLWLVGSGEESFKQILIQTIASNGLSDSVKLYGFVSEEEKFSLLARAHVLISASIQEGWGLTIPEAGLMKTPSVVYNVQGFRDIIEQQKDGILVKKNPTELARNVVLLLKDKSKYNKIQRGAYQNAKTYSWDKTAKVSLQFIKNL